MLYLSYTKGIKEYSMSILERKPKLALRLGSRRALIDGVRVTLDCEPIMNGEDVLIPLSALSGQEATGTVKIKEGSYATGVKGLYKNIDSMGLIMLDTDGEITRLNHIEHKSYMMNIMAEMLFDIERVDMSNGYAPATESQREAFLRIGEDIVRRMNEASATHPMAFSSTDVFERLCAIYRGEPTKDKEYLESVIRWGEKLSAKEEYKLTKDEGALASPLSLREGEDGYDIGGRHFSAEHYSGEAMHLAFTYRITGKQLFAKQAYCIIKEVIKLPHFGPGHFLNCAQAACFLSVSYDWLLDAWEGLKLDTGAIKHAIYEKCIYEGWRSVIQDDSSYPSKKQGTGWRFKFKHDNWNAVCNSGLTVASLVLLCKDDGVLSPDERRKTVELLGAALASLSQADFVLSQYAPDGSYVESNSYWSYGTTALFRVICALCDAIGTDLGLSLSGGLDKTCYYALSSESCDFVGWNYHDGSLSGQDTSIFNMFATVSGDSLLYALRREHLLRGKSPTMFDMLYHPSVRGRSVPKLTDMPLDYYMEGIDAFVVRSGWAAGSLYAGIMGGYNPKGGSHNQLDSGSFVYHNDGVMWFADMGPDYYNITGGYFGNYNLYRRCAEGNNVLSLPSVNFGQGMDCTGKITRHHSGADAFAVIDNSTVYEDKVTAAKRGMLLTNDRMTLVIQDEVDFTSPTDAYFVAHFKSSEITAAVSSDGRHCTLTHESGKSVKVSLIGTDGRITVRDCYDFLLPTTGDFEGEYDRHEYSRLVIEYKNVSKIRSAFVIEPTDSDGYTAITPTDLWGK